MFDHERLLVDIGQIFEKKMQQEMGTLKTEMHQRFEQVDQEFSSLRNEVDRRFDEVNREITLVKKEVRDGIAMWETSVETSNSYYNEIKPRVERLEEQHDILIGRVNLLEA